jgi:hypothetical protein
MHPERRYFLFGLLLLGLMLLLAAAEAMGLW